MYKENGKSGGSYGGRNSSYGNRGDSRPAGKNGGSYGGRSGANGERRGNTPGEGSPVAFRNGEPVFNDGKSSAKDGRGYSKDGKSYGGNGRSYSGDGKSYGGNSRSYSKDGKSYGTDGRGYSRDGKSYGTDGRSYGKSYKKSDADSTGARKYGDKYNSAVNATERSGKKPYDHDNKPIYGKSETRPAKPELNDAQRTNTPEDELPYLVIGRNAVREAIKSGRSIDKILVSRDPDGSLREIMSSARDRNIRIDEVDKSKLDEMCMPFGHGGKTGNHQGILAQVPGVEYCELSDMLNDAKAAGEKPFIILLDGIEDPHNLGSIIRSAVCAGAHGIVIPKRRAVSVTSAACKASAGAVEYCRVARVANLAGAIDRLKDEGLWIAGADMQGMPMGRARMEGALALVIGSEGEGISRLIKEKCDFLVSIPITGKIDSLNASVAAAILMFEKRRQDGTAK